jgi:hypothetical protein
MIETLLGGLLGGGLRMAPELLKWLDRKGEREHELAMQDKALEFEKLRGAQRMQEINAQANSAWDAGTLAALKEAIAGQARPSGVPWVDALSSTVRPVITYLFMATYCVVKAAGIALAIKAGVSWEATVLHAWTEADQAMWAGILNFWYVGRAWERRNAQP